MTSRGPLTRISHCSLTNSISFMSAETPPWPPPDQLAVSQSRASPGVGALQGGGDRAASTSPPGPQPGRRPQPRKPAQHSRPEAASHTEAARCGLSATDRLETEGGWPRGPGRSAARRTAHLLHPPLPSQWNGGWVEGPGRGRPPLKEAWSLGDPSQGRGHRRLSPRLTLRPLRWMRDMAGSRTAAGARLPFGRGPGCLRTRTCPGQQHERWRRARSPGLQEAGHQGPAGEAGTRPGGITAQHSPGLSDPAAPALTAL